MKRGREEFVAGVPGGIGEIYRSLATSKLRVFALAAFEHEKGKGFRGKAHSNGFPGKREKKGGKKEEARPEVEKETQF